MIFVDDSTVVLDGVALPGVLKSFEIKDGAHVEEQEVEGSGVKPKQADGYEDSKVNIELILDDTPGETKLDKLARLRSLFRGPGQELPSVHQIVNDQTAAHNLSQVIFKNLSSKQDNKKQSQIIATLEFWEYIPVPITAVSSSSSSSGSGARGKSTTRRGLYSILSGTDVTSGSFSGGRSSGGGVGGNSGGRSGRGASKTIKSPIYGKMDVSPQAKAKMAELNRRKGNG